jgi:hypothetical protein
VAWTGGCAALAPVHEGDADERRRGLDLRLSGAGAAHAGGADERGRGGAAAWLGPRLSSTGARARVEAAGSADERGRGCAAGWRGSAAEQRWRPKAARISEAQRRGLDRG